MRRYFRECFLHLGAIKLLPDEENTPDFYLNPASSSYEATDRRI